MKRIFVAVDISDDARRRVADYIETLRTEFRQIRVGWEKTEKLHLTLKFLGDADENQLNALNVIVKEISTEIKNFKLEIAETGVFPNARNPRVFWINVRDATGDLGKINARLETECAKIGFEKEKRGFVPHLTIGRVREPFRARELAGRHLQTDFEPVGFKVSKIVIYNSELLPTGSVYSMIKAFDLQRDSP